MADTLAPITYTRSTLPARGEIVTVEVTEALTYAPKIVTGEVVAFFYYFERVDAFEVQPVSGPRVQVWLHS